MRASCHRVLRDFSITPLPLTDPDLYVEDADHSVGNEFRLSGAREATPHRREVSRGREIRSAAQVHSGITWRQIAPGSLVVNGSEGIFPRSEKKRDDTRGGEIDDPSEAI